jgi:hypothetical protein
VLITIGTFSYAVGANSSTEAGGFMWPLSQDQIIMLIGSIGSLLGALFTALAAIFAGLSAREAA